MFYNCEVPHRVSEVIDLKIEWNRRYTTIAIYAFLVIAASILFCYGVLNFEQIAFHAKNIVKTLSPFTYGFVIAYILNPVLRYLEDKVFPVIFGNRVSEKLQRGLAILLTFAFAVAVITIFFWIVIPQIMASLYNLASSIPDYLLQAEAFVNWAIQVIPTENLPEEFMTTLDENLESLYNTVYNIVTALLPHVFDFTRNLTTGVLNVIVGIIISVYMFMSKELFFAQLKKALYAFLPKETVNRAIDLTHEANGIFSGFITGKIIDSLIIGILCFGGLTLIKMPYAMLVSVIVGVTNVIPYFGPFFGAIPSFFIILTASPTKALIFLVFILVLQQFDGNILGPKILGQSTGLSAFWVIFAIMLFGKLFGFVGMFIGVPTFAVIYSVVRSIICSKLQNKKMPTETSAYSSPRHNLLDQ